MINWIERVKAQAAGAQGSCGSCYERSGTDDPGRVPAHVMPALRALAQRYGYQVKITPDMCCAGPYFQVLGQTLCDEREVRILAGMSEASTARVLGHELGHVLAWLSETGTFRPRHLSLDAGGNLEDSAEETACELGTAAFCAAAGIGTGEFVKRYLGQRGGGVVTPWVIREAARNAQALWNACQEYQYRHLAS